MPVFQYKVLDEGGRESTGVTDADSPREARQKLFARKLRVVELAPLAGVGTQTATSQRPSLPAQWMHRFGRIFSHRRRLQELAMVTRQFGTLLQSGIPLMGALTAIIDQVEDRRLKSTLMDVRERVAQGTTLADALGANPDYFNELYVNMVAAGEASGSLDAVLGRLADYLQKQNRIQSKVVAALTYPLLMMIVGTGVVIFLLTYVVPQIMTVIAKQKMALPLPTVMLLAVSNFFRDFWWLLVGAFVALIALYRSAAATDKGRLAIDTMMLRIPLVGNLLRKQAISRFSITFATLLESGLPVLESLQIVKKVVNNRLLADTLDLVRKKIAEGADISTPLKNSKVFPPVVAYMIAVGEESGRLEELLKKISESYDEEIEIASQRLTSMLEPLMIVIMAVIVGFIVLSIMLPIFQMSKI
ncbi:MAG: type II secretion system protein GspF [Planctomycetes bacterium RBG_16_59_8]|nr:MAG: type II secretion system protein GspF [Planctomycetes bacterium RBG_16_59_8]